MSAFFGGRDCRYETSTKLIKAAETIEDPTRREFLRWIAGVSALLVSARLLAVDNTFTATDEEARNKALRRMRQTDLLPSWFTSANWGNGAYKPWTDYLAGKISEPEFMRVCANPSDYCLRDVWNLTKEEPSEIDWSNPAPFNWPGIHALAMRFFRTGDPIYLKKWLAVVDDYAAWSVNPRASLNAQMRQGQPPALLDSAMTWCGIFTAFSIIAKGLAASPNPLQLAMASPYATAPQAPGIADGLVVATAPLDRAKASPYAPTLQELDAQALGMVPSDQIARIARAFAQGHAVDLIRFYGLSKYIPNQRMFGLEAVAYLVAFFPDTEGVNQLAPGLNGALQDLLTRYRQADGGQLEQSFNYAEDVVFGATRVAKLPYNAAPAWMGDASKTTVGWARMSAALVSPVGGLPQVGNAAWGRCGLQKFDGKFAVASIAFPYSGYYAMRSSWSPDAAYLFFFYRRAARGHTMAGCNSIQVAAFGRQLLIAGGSANYSGQSANYPASVAYLAEESSFKTNTIIVDGRSQSGGATQGLPLDANGKPDITIAPNVPVQSRWHSSATFDYVDGLYAEGYKGGLDNPNASLVAGVDHYRQIVFVRPLGLWVVVDTMKTNNFHRYTQIWKFAAPNNGLAIHGFAKHQVVLHPDKRVIQTEDISTGAVNVALHQFGVESLGYRSYFAEDKYGYVGPGPVSAAVPAVDVHATWEGTGSQVLVTVISPFRGMISQIQTAADMSARGMAGCQLELANGARLCVRAAAASRPFEPKGPESDGGELDISLKEPGQPMARIVISPRVSHELCGERQTPILVPSGFRWSVTGDGSLEPSYTA